MMLSRVSLRVVATAVKLEEAQAQLAIPFIDYRLNAHYRLYDSYWMIVWDVIGKNGTLLEASQ
jgi:hypothetical protein